MNPNTKESQWFLTVVPKKGGWLCTESDLMFKRKEKKKKQRPEKQ